MNEASGDGSGATPRAARADVWDLLTPLAEIRPEPLQPLLGEHGADELAARIRRVLVRLLGRELPLAQGDFVRSFRGQLYMRRVSLEPLDLLRQILGCTPMARVPRLWWALRAACVGAALAWRLPRSMRRFEREAEVALPELERCFAARPLPSLSGVSDAELPEYAHGATSAAAWDRVNVLNIYAAAVGDILLKVLGDLLRDWAGDDGRLFLAAISGVGGLRSAEACAELAALADEARRHQGLRERLLATPGRSVEALGDGAEEREFAERFAAFLRRHGHRGFKEASALAPRWSDRPEQALDLVRSLVEGSARARQYTGTDERMARATLGVRPLRRAIFSWVLQRAHATLRIRENSKALLSQGSARVRATALEAGRRLTARGLLDRDDAVLFLSGAEVERALRGQPEVIALRAAARRRRREWEAWASEPAPRTVDANGLPIAAADAVAPDHVAPDLSRGTPASGGTGAGPARVILDPANGLAFAEGSVLVAPYTDTAWTPLFYLAAAVVVETGSVLSHASIVARELGVPCVVGVHDATSWIKDGDWVDVDADRGLIRVSRDARSAALPASRAQASRSAP
jgi:pyruvate,water dikinase